MLGGQGARQTHGWRVFNCDGEGRCVKPIGSGQPCGRVGVLVEETGHLSSRLAQANLVDERAGVAVVAVLVVALGSSTRSSTSTSTRSIISSSTTTTSRRSTRSASSRNGAFGRTVWVAQICLTEATQERLGFSS